MGTKPVTAKKFIEINSKAKCIENTGASSDYITRLMTGELNRHERRVLKREQRKRLKQRN